MTDDELTDEEALEAVEAEMRPGGRALARYMELGIIDRAPLLGQVLSTRIVANIEDRLAEVERHLGLDR